MTHQEQDRATYSDIRSDGRSLHEQLKEDQMWGEIRRMARTDPGMQDLIERVIVYYKLKKHDR
jgi:hypothetical protein